MSNYIKAAIVWIFVTLILSGVLIGACVLDDKKKQASVMDIKELPDILEVIGKSNDGRYLVYYDTEVGTMYLYSMQNGNFDIMRDPDGTIRKRSGS